MTRSSPEGRQKLPETQVLALPQNTCGLSARVALCGTVEKEQD